MEDADRFTMLFPIRIAESIFPESFVMRRTRSAFLSPFSESVRIRILFTVVNAVSEEEKNEESASSTSKLIICAISPASKIISPRKFLNYSDSRQSYAGNLLYYIFIAVFKQK